MSVVIRPAIPSGEMSFTAIGREEFYNPVRLLP
jgi:hypothetical protein